MEKYGFVYIWFDRKHKRYYIGSHWGTEDDGYICSSRWMRKAYKRRPEDFKRKIISKVFTDRKELLNKEFEWLSLIEDTELKSKYYNVTKHKNGHWMAEDYEKDVRKRISQNTKEAMQRPDIREKYLKGLKTRDCRSSDIEVREKRRQSMINTMAEKFPEENRWKKLSPEGRTQYYSDKAKKIWSNPRHKENVGAKISQSLKGVQNRLGHKNSPEHTAKIVKANKEKTRLKMESHRPLIEQTLHMTAIEASKIVGVGRQIVTKYRKELGYIK
jgi:hypothetical protein